MQEVQPNKKNTLSFVIIMLVIFGVIIWQNKRNAALMLEKEAADVEQLTERMERLIAMMEKQQRQQNKRGLFR